MKGCVLLLLLAVGLSAQEHADEAKKQGATSESHEPDDMLGWKWINFALLAAGLGYLIFKNVPPLLRARSEEIRSGMREASKLKAEADAKAADIEQRLGGIAGEIEKLRTELASGMMAEGERIKSESERLALRIHEQAQQEVAFLTKAARQELKSFSASLSLDLAAQRIRERMNPDTQHRLVDAFVSDLSHSDHGGMTVQ